MKQSSYEQAKSLAFVLLKKYEIPTLDQVKEAVQKALMVADEPSAVDADLLTREIQSQMNILIPDSANLSDDREHEHWLPDSRSSIDWHFWRRYVSYLEQQKNMPAPVIASLDRLTDTVLEKIELPSRPGSWDRRGMVVGQVQSGKTANYTGLICKAVDAGYKLIIVLAGVHNSLRSQTQMRIDEGFLGFDTKRDRAFSDTSPQIGAGRILTEKRLIAHSLTSSAEDGDFRNAIARKIGVQIGGDPVILVVKKFKSVLNNLLKYVCEQPITIFPDGRRVLRNLPVLLIDDEADHASVNTKEVMLDADTGLVLEEQDVTAINGLIRKILSTFDQSVYVGYTATPFANIFIYPHQPDENINTYGEDLFPRSFIVSLPSPSNYLGPVQVFGLDEFLEASLKSEDGLPIVRAVHDSNALFPSSHRKTHSPRDLPASLREAIRCFIITCAAREARGQGDEHNSMLIHVTRFTDVQQKTFDLVAAELVALQNRLRYGDGALIPSLRTELRELWYSDFAPASVTVIARIDDPRMTNLTWDQVDGCLVTAASKIQVRVINGTQADVLDYYECKTGLSVIAIGGDKLSRGLTLEGLSVSYYLRSSKMYDTLMQMGRWFGYRPGYADLCRLYTTPELIGWYRHITVASEELRQDFERMARLNQTPEEFGLRVQTHPGGLIITAVNKMKAGTKMRVSFDLKLVESTVFSEELTDIRANLNSLTEFLGSLQISTVQEGGDFRWNNIPGERVAAFLGSLSAHPFSIAKPDKLEQYIKRKVDHGELINWTVIVNGNQKYSNGYRHMTGAEIDVGLTFRSKDDLAKTDGAYTLKRRHLLSANDEERDLSNSQKMAALRLTQEDWANKKSSRDKPKSASGMRVREQRLRSNGLLLFYLLDPTEASDGGSHGVPFVGYAVSFPGTAFQSEAAEYMVDKTYLDREFQS
jgi:hypothetical protein